MRRTERQSRSSRSAARAWIRFGSLLCPPGFSTQFADYRLGELRDPAQPEGTLRIAAESIGHFRRHGGFALAGVVLVGAGTFLYGFTSTSPLLDITWVLAGIGIALMVPLVRPTLPTVRGGCPYSVQHTPPPATPSRRQPKLTILIGLVLCAATTAEPLHPVLFDIPTIVGVAVTGIGLVLLGVSSQRQHMPGFARALYLTAVGGPLVAFGDGGSGLFDLSPAIDFAATVVTLAGSLLYTASIRDLVRCYRPPTTPTTEQQRRPRAHAA